MLHLFIEWTVSPELLPGTFFERLRWYGLLWAAGFYIGFYIMKNMYKQENQDQKPLDDLFVYMFIGSILGARLGHCLFYGPYHTPSGNGYFDKPWTMLYVWEGGLASHGGGIGILLALWLFVKKYKVDFLYLLDRLAIVIALAATLIRLGNLMNHEIIGHVSNAPWAFLFKYAGIEDGVNLSVDPRHPTQLYEAICYFGIFIFLYWLWNKYKSSTPRGLIAGTFFILVFGARFFIEFFKIRQEDHDLSLLNLNMGHLLSIPFIAIGVWMLINVRKNTSNA